jgi:hypothetical protein
LSFFPPPHHAPLPPMPSPPTESWFAIRIKGSFATQSGAKQTSQLQTPTSEKDPKETLGVDRVFEHQTCVIDYMQPLRRSCFDCSLPSFVRRLVEDSSHCGRAILIVVRSAD